MKPVRCAIYTRKSSEEGLEQDFNSLDAQREACSAYILSQASEGWTEVTDRYDDGGLSGGTLERPALQRLLGDTGAGRIDIIVVYKVDQLTRSLLDFSKLVEAFDKAGTSFVSVTQSFNTTTSMGRLTLNMLLSFAQFEREVTAERIRDKLAASKAKGMWMGGIPPVGYKPNGRTLAIVEEEATIVRGIFDRYLALGNVRLVMEALARDRIVTPARNTTRGGQRPFSRGQIYTILKNPIYIGRIRHGDKTYPGLHAAIIDQDIWDRTQAGLADNLQGARKPVRSPHRAMLAGKVVDRDGRPLHSEHATVGTTRYRYYRSDLTVPATSRIRIPARQLETAVIDCIGKALGDPFALAQRCGITLGRAQLRRLLEGENSTNRASRDQLCTLITQVRVMDDALEIECLVSNIATLLDLPCPAEDRELTLTRQIALRRSGQAIRLVRRDGMPLAEAPNSALIRLLALGHRWWHMLRSRGLSVRDLAHELDVTPPYVSRVMRLAFLSPKVTDAILAGSANAMIGCRVLTRPEGAEIASLPWREQECVLLGAR